MYVDKTNNTPFYLQVRNKLRENIESGVWKEGELIPSEKELAELYGVSRVTIRNAISQLTQQQYLVRRAGFGTIVYQNKSSLSNFTLVRSFSNEMKEMGMPCKTLEIEFEEIPAGKKLASIFNINPDDRLYNLRRVRGTQVPILFSDTYLLPIMKKPVNLSVLGESLYRYLGTQNIYFNHFEEYVSAVTGSKDIKNRIKVFDDTPLLKRIRYAYNEQDKLIEYSETYYNSNLYEYRTEIIYRKQ
ncbi:MAG: GntR family transcriptional regulator [Acholeplasmataceae bacterium]|nr:GntR family transcriptional regulator [Acholeplasmataceae bacterium]